MARFARWLPAGDAELVDFAYGMGRPLAELARLRGVPDWALQRRLRLLALRVASREYRFVALKLERLPEPPCWPPRGGDLEDPARFTLTVARGVYIAGESMRRTAERLGVRLHVVRRTCDVLLMEMTGAVR